MTNAEIAERLQLFAMCLELAGADAFRVRSYQNAAARLATSALDVDALARSGRVTELPGVGEGIGGKIETIVETGTLPELDALLARIPRGVINLMRMPELGPERAITLYGEAGIDSLEALAVAARAGRISRLEGFGPRTEARLLAAAERRREGAGRVRLDVADSAAAGLLAALPLRAGEHVSLAGPQRRRCETIDRLVFLVRSRRIQPFLDAFVAHASVSEPTHRTERSAHVTLKNGVRAELHVAMPAAFATTLLRLTGDAEHVAAVEHRAQTLGLRFGERRLYKKGRAVPAAGEAELYSLLGLPHVPAELRDTTDVELDVISAGAEALITRGDLRGLVHVHSTWSDGTCSIADSVRVAGELGAGYIVIADHSEAATYAGGMSPARVRMQKREIETINAGDEPVRVLHGIEVDILPDGNLDYDDALLGSFEVVIASVHGGFSLGEEKTFERLERALSHPAVQILGHPTGRFLLERDPYVRDAERLVDLCVRKGVVIEINALPKRLDLDWRLVRYARGRGARFVVSSDAHSVEDLVRTQYGIDVARKGRLTPKDVLNTRDADAFLAALAETKGTSS